MKDKNQGEANATTSQEDLAKLSEDMMELLSKRTKNPSEAFVLLQQMAIFVWHQYKVDWTERSARVMSADRKQRFLDYVSQLTDNLVANYQSADQNPDKPAE